MAGLLHALTHNHQPVGFYEFNDGRARANVKLPRNFQCFSSLEFQLQKYIRAFVYKQFFLNI